MLRSPLGGPPKMLLPTIGMGGEIPAASFICLVLGLLSTPISATAP